MKAIDVLEIMEKPENSHVQELVLVPPKRWWDQKLNWSTSTPTPTAWATNQGAGRLEGTAQQEKHRAAITETWWDDWHNWSAAMAGQKVQKE